jgi:hypothetical protein
MRKLAFPHDGTLDTHAAYLHWGVHQSVAGWGQALGQRGCHGLRGVLLHHGRVRCERRSVDGAAQRGGLGVLQARKEWDQRSIVRALQYKRQLPCSAHSLNSCESDRRMD